MGGAGPHDLPQMAIWQGGTYLIINPLT
jgi:hypothetical protein